MFRHKAVTSNAGKTKRAVRCEGMIILQLANDGRRRDRVSRTLCQSRYSGLVSEYNFRHLLAKLTKLANDNTNINDNVYIMLWCTGVASYGALGHVPHRACTRNIATLLCTNRNSPYSIGSVQSPCPEASIFVPCLLVVVYDCLLRSLAKPSV